jgi:cyclopropane fatty-acyl-phospholipid synthase-like methyltransferase
MYSLQANQDYRLTDNTDKQLLNDTARYYEECQNDYLFAWCNRNNLALHYGYWDSTADYDHHQALLNTNRILYEQAGIQASEHVLDAGCGLGGSSLWMAEQQHNQVTGITISPKQAAYATKQAQRRHVDQQVNFEVCDYMQTPFESESFDVIWFLESACYALNKVDLMKEAYRLLRPGGRLALADAFLLKSEFTEQEWQTVQTFLTSWVVPNLCQHDEFSQLLTQTGFKSIQTTDISQQTLPSSKHMYKVTKRLYPVQKISQWLGLRSVAQTANYQGGLAQYDFFHQRLAEYRLFTARKPI